MNMIVGTAIAGTAVTSLPAAAADDPIFAAIETYKKVRTKFGAALDALTLIERELKAAGDLFPRTISKGNPYSGLPAPESRTHTDIDLYTPVDLYPLENEREHAELSAAITRRDARLIPAEEAVDATGSDEREAIGVLVQTVPTTMPGVMAMLEFHRDWEAGDDPDADYLTCLVESVHLALEEMQSA